MRDDIPIGPTGRFPNGKLSEGDEGELWAAIGEHKGRVVVDFGKPVAWLAMPPDAARDIAVQIMRRASRIDGKPIVVSIGG